MIEFEFKNDRSRSRNQHNTFLKSNLSTMIGVEIGVDKWSIIIIQINNNINSKLSLMEIESNGIIIKNNYSKLSTYASKIKKYQHEIDSNGV